MNEYCKCDCCIYWRRRMNRIAADKDKTISRQNTYFKSLERQYDDVRCERDAANSRVYKKSVEIFNLKDKIKELEKRPILSIIRKAIGL